MPASVAITPKNVQQTGRTPSRLIESALGVPPPECSIFDAASGILEARIMNERLLAIQELNIVLWRSF
jgi:hypothetical protein